MSLFKLYDLQMHHAAEAAFATDEGGNFSAMHIQTINRPTVNAVQDSIDDPTVEQSALSGLPPIKGLKNKSKLAFQTFLRGTGLAGSGAAATSSTNPTGLLLKEIMGGESGGTGTIVEENATTTSIPATTAAGLAVGQAMLIGLEAMPIKQIAANTITPKAAFAAAPNHNDVLYAGASYYLKQSPAGTLQFRGLSAEAANSIYKLLGCFGGLSIGNLNPGQNPHIAWDLMITDWARSTGTLSDQLSNYSAARPSIPGIASKLYIGAYSGTARTVKNCSSFALNLNMGTEQIPSVSGIQGIQGFLRTFSKNPAVEIVTDYDASWFAGYDNGTQYFIHYQIGTVAGLVVLIEIPCAVLAVEPAESAVGQKTGMKLNFQTLSLNSCGSTPTSELTNSPVLIHLL